MAEGASGSGTVPTTEMDRQVREEVAAAYLYAVEVAFKDEPDKHKEFLKILDERDDPDASLGKLRVLFKGHPHLLLGMNSFMANHNRIHITETEMPMKQADLQETINFIAKLKYRFQVGETQVCKSFEDIMLRALLEEKSLPDIYKEVAVLLRHHPDLLKEFAAYFY